jgi:gamma-glutamylcyclotransferase (GGCT)/AIG2-like uncharacterized protein YtfP
VVKVYLRREWKVEKIFVYGSLMKGLRLHGYLKTSKYLGKDCVAGILLTNPYLQGDIPVLIYGEGLGVVQGEVYEISEELLKTLDRVEGVPQLYKRKSLSTRCGFEDVWVYIWPGEVVKSGNWREHVEN